MQMTDYEILTEYRQAKEPKEQVKILAELNGTTIEKINEILKSQGVDGRKLPKPRIKNDNKENDIKPNMKKGRNKVNKNKEIPITTLNDVINFINTLKEHRKALSEEIAKIDETLERIVKDCGFPLVQEKYNSDDILQDLGEICVEKIMNEGDI